MKIAIVGAGIGGLAAYHALKKHLIDDAHDSNVEIKIYESHSSPTSTTSIIGAGLGLAPNGIRAIASLSPDAATYIQERGFPGAEMTFRNSKGVKLGCLWSVRKERYGHSQLMLPRAAVHEALLQDIPSGVAVWGARVKDIRENEEGVEIEFEDGSVENVDLVVGADGVRSVIRECIFSGQYPAEYDGLTGVGGFIPYTLLSETFKKSLKQEGVTMVFGSHGFFGYSMCSPHSDNDNANLFQWWSIYESPSPPPLDTPSHVIGAQLLERHGAWISPYDTPDSPIYTSIINMACSSDSEIPTDRRKLLILPRYVVTRLQHWCSPSGRVILLGDAAHAMPPDSGQGVSCAVEDAVAIALLLKHYSRGGTDYSSAVLKQAASAYERIRIPRVRKILDWAKRSGDAKKKLKWWQEKLRDWAMWLICKLPESINDSLFGYDVEVEHFNTWIKTPFIIRINPSIEPKAEAPESVSIIGLDAGLIDAFVSDTTQTFAKFAVACAILYEIAHAFPLYLQQLRQNGYSKFDKECFEIYATNADVGWNNCTHMETGIFGGEINAIVPAAAVNAAQMSGLLLERDDKYYNIDAQVVEAWLLGLSKGETIWLWDNVKHSIINRTTIPEGYKRHDVWTLALPTYTMLPADTP
uniref:FAD-binding protein n=1 Tax=Volvariella volvacea TaxID=36659 RepID=M9Z9S5_9AGAR|nr:FAD-binding protein [Volvariella volvacea]